MEARRFDEQQRGSGTGTPPVAGGDVGAPRPWERHRVRVAPLLLFWAVVVAVATAVGVLSSGGWSVAVIVIAAGGFVSMVVGLVLMCGARPFDRPWHGFAAAERRQIKRVVNRPSRYVALPAHLRAAGAAGLVHQLRVGGAVMPWWLPGFTALQLHNLLHLRGDVDWIYVMLWGSWLMVIVLGVQQLVIRRRTRAVLRAASTAHSTGPVAGGGAVG